MARWSGEFRLRRRGSSISNSVLRHLAVGRGAAAGPGDEAIGQQQLALGERLGARAVGGGDEAQVVGLAVLGDLDALPPRLVRVEAAAAGGPRRGSPCPPSIGCAGEVGAGEHGELLAAAMARSSNSSMNSTGRSAPAGRAGIPSLRLAASAPRSSDLDRVAQQLQAVMPVPTSRQLTLALMRPAACAAGPPRLVEV